MRRTMTFAAAVLVAALAVTTAVGVSVHWKKGSPQFSDNGLTLEESGTVAGVGGGDILVILTARGNPSSTCTNPGTGEHQPPGQNPAEVVLTGVQPIPEQEIKNGNLSYDVETTGPTTPIPGAPDCPNPKWREDITDIAFTSATLTIRQDTNGSADPSDASTYEAVVFQAPSSTCTFDPATSDGSVSDFSCPRR